MHVAGGVGHAGQYAALGLFLAREARPLDGVAHGASGKHADAGAAGTVAAGTRPVDAALFHGLQQGLFGPGIALRAVAADTGDEERRRGGGRRHGKEPPGGRDRVESATDHGAMGVSSEGFPLPNFWAMGINPLWIKHLRTPYSAAPVLSTLLSHAVRDNRAQAGSGLHKIWAVRGFARKIKHLRSPYSVVPGLST